MGLCVLTASLRKQTGGGIQDGLQPVLQLAGVTSENRQDRKTFAAGSVACRGQRCRTRQTSSVSIARSSESSASGISASTLRTAVSVVCIALYAD